MARAGDPPATWKIQLSELGEPVHVVMYDRLRVENGVPAHLGLGLDVDVPASDIDTAVQTARRHAESLMILLAGAGRAPIRSLQIAVAYEITPGLSERPFAQWFPDAPIAVGKSPAPTGVFGALLERLPALQDQRLIQRLMMSMSWHRQALDETEPLFRFNVLWISFEAISPLFDDFFELRGPGAPGLKHLADEAGYGSQIISEALGVRADLVHANRVLPDELRRRAAPLVPILERLLVVGWFRLLGISEQLEELPASAVTPYSTTLVLRGVLLQEDVSGWGIDVHPTIEGEPIAQRQPDDAGAPGRVNVTYSFPVTCRNVQGWRPERFEVWGPSGPNVATITSTAVSVNLAEPPGTDQ